MEDITRTVTITGTPQATQLAQLLISQKLQSVSPVQAYVSKPLQCITHQYLCRLNKDWRDVRIPLSTDTQIRSC